MCKKLCWDWTQYYIKTYFCRSEHYVNPRGQCEDVVFGY